MNILEIANLDIYSSEGKSLVSDLSFSIAPGARLGLIGESGSGKSPHLQQLGYCLVN
jgi:peptide/nickel transport system ATP-binding protein